MIEVRNVNKSFEGFQALNDVNITVEKGTVYGLVGPNGAGKSTLIRTIMGIYRPEQGTITVDGEPVFDNPKAKQRMLCIYDDIYYYMSATTADMKKLYEKLYPSFSQERYEKLKQIFPEVNEKTPLRNLSKGLLKQSAFLLSMSCCPEILLLDEPVDGLDPIMRRQVWSVLLGDVAERGTTVLLSSHNLRELEDVCDHVGILHHGKVLLERNLSDLQESITKLQILFPGDVPELGADMAILHHSNTGRMHTYIIRSSQEAVQRTMEQYSPVYMEALPLTLEEIFVYELGGAHYAVQDILL